MKQLELELEWLTNPEWKPTSVKVFTNRGISSEEFDNWQAKNYGYKNHEDMVSHNLLKDRASYLKYGDRTKGLI